MRKSVLLFVGVCLCAAMALGQNKVASSWTCQKPSNAQSIAIPDHPNHAYAIAQFTCTASKGEIGGVKDKEGTVTEFDDVDGNGTHGHGIFVETLANGDKIHIRFESSSATKNGQFQSGSDKWQISEATGKLKGAKGSGTCTGKGNADGSSNWTCTGSYSSAK